MWMIEAMYAHGWDDAEWAEDGQPLRFPTKRDAEAAIDGFVTVMQEAGIDYERADYRAVEVQGED